MIKAELKRCITIERRWNRNEVSSGSPDKEVNRRPTSLKKFRADALRGAKGLNCDRLEYKIRRKGRILSFLPDWRVTWPLVIIIIMQLLMRRVSVIRMTNRRRLTWRYAWHKVVKPDRIRCLLSHLPPPLCCKHVAECRICTAAEFHNAIRYDTRCYFIVRSEADISQFGLSHGTNN